MPTHDVVTIGASAGGVEAMRALVQALPANLPAAIFIVIHTQAGSPGMLPVVLSHATQLPVHAAEDRMPIRP